MREPQSFKCTCGKVSKLSAGGSIADEQKQSGFRMLFTQECGTLWFCPACFAKMKKLAKAIFAISNNEHIYFKGLLKED